jgi:imidazole glycerol phosphate synthase glutamine amidotransferase subunit
MHGAGDEVRLLARRAVERPASEHEGVAVITIVDYGAGNLRSVQNTLSELGAAYRLTRSAAEIETADKVILPGVGHFGQMMRAFEELGIGGALKAKAQSGTPLLGICLGLQALFESSEEAPGVPGMALFPGVVRRFPAPARVPHMGWNSVAPKAGAHLFAGAGEKPCVYFANSYWCPVVDATAAVCHYTLDFTAALESGNIFGVQFHPEKSGPLGLRIMKNFVEL